MYGEVDRDRLVFVDVVGGNGHVIEEVLQPFAQIRLEILTLAHMTGPLQVVVRNLEHGYRDS
ncbi:O-methyltransferase- family 2 [Apiospora rasikravindrae]|uniref:O-methyltransferase- family 2 n=1 Tax=Apiospora rasikravindrae TaxID=990691 RepID=A0ABR1RW28_9PEZI